MHDYCSVFHLWLWQFSLWHKYKLQYITSTHMDNRVNKISTTDPQKYQFDYDFFFLFLVCSDQEASFHYPLL